MAYILNQYNQRQIAAEDVFSAENQVYMTPIVDGTAKRRRNIGDSGLKNSSLSVFFDECIVLNSKLVQGNNYYLHTRIKRLSSEQTFFIYLVNYDEADDTSAKTQYLKTITVQGGLETEWVDFEIIFNSLLNFDCVLFQLQRNIEDYQIETRYPIIVYEELSLINNLISSKIKRGASLAKIGIQSHPGLLLCINNEEIHIGKTGVYEIRNGIVSVDFLSVISAAIENPNGKTPLYIQDKIATLEEYLAYLSNLKLETSLDSTNSVCLFANSKIRKIDSFVVDYLYRED